MTCSPSPVWLTVALLTLGGAGCLKLEPQSDPTRFYVLPSPKPEASRPPGLTPAAAPPVFVARVELPDYLQNPGLAIRTGDTRIDYIAHHHWAEPLRDGVTRVLQDALSLSRGTGPIHPGKFRRPGGPYLDLQVTLTRFECTADGSAVLAARWTLSHQPDRRPLASGETSTTEPFPADPNDYSAAVSALGQCVTGLAEEIARQGLTPENGW